MINLKKLAVVSVLGISAMSYIAPAMAISPAAVITKKAIHEERKDHPRLSRAIKELQEAIDYLEKAPDTFGGHKADAIAASKKAVEELKKALEFKVIQQKK